MSRYIYFTKLKHLIFSNGGSRFGLNLKSSNLQLAIFGLINLRLLLFL
jgi:hypothetical protein